MKKSKRRLAYEANKNAKVGENIVCPICHKTFKKRQYSQAFCCGQCKDAFWNAKRDRHSAGYYEKYNSKHPERKVRAALYSMDIVTARDTDEIYARMALANDEEYKYNHEFRELADWFNIVKEEM